MKNYIQLDLFPEWFLVSPNDATAALLELVAELEWSKIPRTRKWLYYVQKPPASIEKCIIACLEHISLDAALHSEFVPLIPKLVSYLQQNEYKMEMVTILGNIMTDSRKIQDFVRKEGGLPLLAKEAKIQDDYPFMKERAIFAIRNACKGNLENQAWFNQLKAQSTQVAENEFLKDMNLKASIADDGKVKVQSL
jgi:hypothetical protein